MGDGDDGMVRCCDGTMGMMCDAKMRTQGISIVGVL